MRKILVAIFILFAYTIVSAQSETILLRTADSLSTLKKYDAAITVYSKLLQQKPQHQKALTGRAFAYGRSNKLALAEKDYKEAIRLNDTCLNCHIKIGTIKLFQNDHSAALVAAETALRIDNKSPAPWVLKGRISHAQKNYSEASSFFDKAISLDSNNAEVYYFRSRIFIESQKFESAISDLSRVIQLSPGNADAYFKMGAIYGNQKKWDEAIKYFTLAVQKDSLDGEYHKSLGQTYISKEDFPNAAKYFTKAIKLNDKDGEAYMYRGEIHYSLEDMDASCSDYKAALERLDPGKEASRKFYITARIAEFCDSAKAEYYYQRGIANYNLNRFDKAVEWYNKGSAKFPGHYMLTSFKAGALLKLNQYDNAESEYTKAILLKDKLAEETRSSAMFREATPQQKQGYIMHTIAELYSHRAEARLAQENFAGAMADADEALKIFPPGESEIENFYYVKGSIYLAQQDNGSALTWFNKAIQANAKYPEALIGRAIVKVNLGYKTNVINSEIFARSARQPNSRVSLVLQRSKTTMLRDNVESALADCNKAIAADPKFAYAFYIRGIVKMGLDQADYCYDILKSEQLGFAAAKPVIEELKCR